MIQRAGDERDAARLHAVLGDLGIALRRREIDDQLGAPGAAAGGHRAHVDAAADPEARASESAASGSKPAGTLRPFAVLARLDADHEARLRELDDGPALELGQARRDRLRRRAELPDREAGFDELDCRSGARA